MKRKILKRNFFFQNGDFNEGANRSLGNLRKKKKEEKEKGLVSSVKCDIFILLKIL